MFGSNSYLGLTNYTKTKKAAKQAIDKYGTRINSTTPLSDNGNVEKYCYSNTDASCSTYGALYT